MDPLALSDAAIIALAGSAAFTFVALSWQRLARTVASNASFPQSILHEAAQQIRDRLERQGRRQSLYLHSVLVFALLFGAVYLLRPQPILGQMPNWLAFTLLGVAAAVGLLGLYRLAAGSVAQSRLRFQHDASVAVGHGLQQLSANQNRVFHDVSCAAGDIDHVIVGLHGIYAVFVVARKPRKDPRVRLNGDQLAFAPGNVVIPLEDCGRKAERLARECSKHASQAIRVRPVIAVPGWDVDAQSSSQYLVVNERNLAMMRGWKDSNDYLLNEDVEVIQNLLTERCTRFAGGKSPQR